MRQSTVFLAAALGTLAFVQQAYAQDLNERADRKITGDYFRPHSASTYQRGAVGHAETLNYYGRRYSQVPAETAKEHAAEIRRNLNAATKEYAKLQKEAKSNKKVQEHLSIIQKHQAKELKSAEAESEKLLKTLGVEPLHKAQSPEHAAAKK